MKTLGDALSFARVSAHTAIDSCADHGTYAKAVQSHRINVRDTLAERGLSYFRECHAEADSAFCTAVSIAIGKRLAKCVDGALAASTARARKSYAREARELAAALAAIV